MRSAALTLGLAVLVLGGLLTYATRLAGRLRRDLESPPDGEKIELGIAAVARRHRRPITMLMILTLLETALGLASPWPLKFVVDYAIGGGRLPASLSFLAGVGRTGVAVAMGVIGVGLVAALAAVGYAAALLAAAVSESVGLRLSSALVRRLLHLPLAYHDSVRSGDLVSRVTTDVAHVQSSLLAKVEILLPQLLAVAGMAVLMAWLSPLLTVAVVAAIPLLAAIGLVRRRAIAVVQRQSRKASGDLAGHASELLANVRLVQSFGDQEEASRRFGRLAGQSAAASVQSAATSARLSPAADLVLA